MSAGVGPRVTATSRRSSTAASRELLDAPRLRQHEPLLGQVVEQATAPQAERGLDRRGRVVQALGGERGAADDEQLLEPREVERVGRGHQGIARPARLDHRLPGVPREHPAEVGDVDLDDVGRGLRRRVAPQLVDEAVDAQRLARVEREQREQRTLARRSQVQRDAVALHRERPQ